MDGEEGSIFGQLLSDYIRTCAEIGVDENDRILKVLEKENARENGMDFRLTPEPASTAPRQTGIALLDLSGNDHLVCPTEIRVEDGDVDALCLTLAKNPAVVRLDLRYNRIKDAGARRLANFLKESKTLEELVVSCNDIGPQGGAAIGESLVDNTSLKRLRINGNKIDNKGGMAFAAALQGNRTLRSLDLGDTDQRTESVVALTTVLNHNDALLMLNLNNPLLFSQEEETTVHIANMLKVNSGLKEIHLQKQSIRDFGATRLSEKLVHNQTLTYLDLSQNRITRDGAYQLSLLLSRNTPLRLLDLGGNRLEDDGALHLANSLANNSNLAALVVTNNKIGVKGLCAICQALSHNRGLTNLYVWGNDLGRPAAEAFKRLVDSRRLQPKNIDVQPYVVDGVVILAQLSHGIMTEYYWYPRCGPQSHLYKMEERIEGGSMVPFVKIAGSA